MNKHTILFLAADPLGSDRLALDREARAVQVELERSRHRDRFDLVTRWAVEPLDLLRELRKLRPRVVHFSGHGGHPGPSGFRSEETLNRDVVVDDHRKQEESQGILYLQGPDGRPQPVSARALQETFGAAGSSVQLVVLNACYSAVQAAALLAYVDCVIGVRSAVRDEAARSFAIGFYGGLAERESVAAAYRQGCAAINLEGLSKADRPQLMIRNGVDAEKLVLADDMSTSSQQTSAATNPSDDAAWREARADEPGPPERKRILIIDDDYMMMKVLAEVLLGEGYDVVLATNENEGREQLRAFARGQHHFDLAIVDFILPATGVVEFSDDSLPTELPRGGGVRLLSYMRHDLRISDSRLPAFCMSQIPELDFLGSSGLRMLGVAKFFQKPFSVEDLLISIRVAISGVPAPPPPPPPPKKDRGVVFHIEHDRSRLQQLDMMLSARGYTVVSMTRALVQLKRLARALRPRAILLDCVCEGVDDFIRELLDGTVHVDMQIPLLVFSRTDGTNHPGTLKHATDVDLVGFVERQC